MINIFQARGALGRNDEDMDDARMIAKELIDYCEKLVVELNCSEH